MISEAADFRAESEALHSLLETADGATFDAPTQFKAWTINDILQHLHVWNHAAVLSLRDEAEFRRFVQQMRDEPGGLRAFENSFLAGLRGRPLAELWITTAGDAADRLEQLDPKQRLAWTGPSMSARSMATARQMETWAHGQAIYDLLGVERADADRIRNIAHLGVSTFGWTYAVREQTPPALIPYVRLRAPSGAVWEWGDPASADRIEGDATQFCQVVTQTRNVADTSLATAGPVAAEWMSMAQCFAGAAKTPPRPGLRFRQASPVPAQWPDAAFQELGLAPPRARIPLSSGPQDVASAIDRSVREQPDRLALVGRHTRLTYGELDAAINAGAAFLSSLGVKAGDRVAGTCANHPDLIVAFFAVQRLGAIWVGINRNFAPPEKRYMLEDAGVSLYLAEAASLEGLATLDAPPSAGTVRLAPGSADCQWRQGLDAYRGADRPGVAIDPWAPGAIAYTSGTTGLPKGVAHSQHSLVLAAQILLHRSDGYEPGVVIGSALPISVLNLMILGPLAACIAGATHVSMDRIDSAGVAEWLCQEPITHLALVPSIVGDLLSDPSLDPAALANMRFLAVGAAVVPEGLPALYEARFGKKMTVSYGITEGPTGVAGANDDTSEAQGAIGVALPHLQVTIRNEANEAVPFGETAEICFAARPTGPFANQYSGPLGYWGRPDATAALLAGGWVHTGDLGRMDANGQITIEGRRSDLIIRGGANIYPAEVERVLRMDPRVKDCVVLGQPDARLGEIVAAFVEADPTAATEPLLADLRTLCQSQIAAYKIPVAWRVVDTLPRNAMGKVVKSALRERPPEESQS